MDKGRTAAMPPSPRDHGFRMPAEWEPHEATWIAWPHNRDDWPGKFGPIPWVYVEIVRLRSRTERVEIRVEGGGDGRRARAKRDRAGVDPQRGRPGAAATAPVEAPDKG